jgi:hypothetical protein
MHSKVDVELARPEDETAAGVAERELGRRGKAVRSNQRSMDRLPASRFPLAMRLGRSPPPVEFDTAPARVGVM